MKSFTSAHKGSRQSARGIVAIGSCIFGIGLVFFGFAVVQRSGPQGASVEASPATETANKKTVSNSNFAPGNVVLLAQELGFRATNTKETDIEPAKIAGRISSQLPELRTLYRHASEKNQNLMGGMMLRLSVGESGDVLQVKELASRITDTTFTQAVIAEVSKWSFHEVTSESITIDCPLLFVRQGMDITTLVAWEKSLGQFGDRGAVAAMRNRQNPSQLSKAVEAPNPVETGFKTAAPTFKRTAGTPVVKFDTSHYYVRYATSVRRGPSFSSNSIARFDAGTKIYIIQRHGDWVAVRGDDSGVTGFIRKEFVTGTEVAHKP